MGVGQAVFYASLIFAAVAVLVVIGALRISARRRPRDLSDTIAEQIAAAETDYYTELRAAPVVGVPYVAVTDDGSHDLYPHMSQHARDAVVASLNEQLAMPARERAQ